MNEFLARCVDELAEPVLPDGMTAAEAITELEQIRQQHRDHAADARRYIDRSGANAEARIAQQEVYDRHIARRDHTTKLIRRLRDLCDTQMREYRCNCTLKGWHIGHLPNALPRAPMPRWGQRGSRTARERAETRYRRAVARQQLANDAGYGIPAVRLMRADDRHEIPRPDYREWGR